MPKECTAGPRLSAPDSIRLESIRRETRNILSGALGTTSKDVVFLDFPAHRNFGDALIWRGTQRYLSELGFRVRYVADHRSFKDHHLRELPADCLIIMHGGGNLGDLYPKHEIFRRHVVSTFRQRRIVIMPQTVHFADRSALAESVAVYRRATGLTILLREPMSMGIADDAFGSLDYRFCPDHAFGAPLEGTRRHSRGSPVILGRHDKEARNVTGGEFPDSLDWSPSRTNAQVWKNVLRSRRALGLLPPGLRSVTVRAYQWSYAVLTRIRE